MSAADLLSAAGWAVLHSLWQGALVYAGWRAAQPALRDPRARYGAALAALGASAIMAVATGAVVLASWLPGAAAGGGAAPAGTGPAAVPGTVVTLYGFLAPAAPWIGGAWLLLTAAAAVRLVAAWRRGRAIVRRATRWRSPLDLRALARTVGVRRRVPVLTSTDVGVPTLVGVRRPVILVPPSVGAGVEDDGLRAVLLHELVHVRRHDAAVNLVHAVIEVAAWWHPAVRRLSREVRHERECCCDDAVVAARVSPRRYATALAAIADLRARGGSLALASHDGALLDRIRRLADRTHRPHRRFGAVTLPALMVAATGAAAPRLLAPHAAGVGRPQRAPTGTFTIRASDPAGPFTVSFNAGRVTAATMDGVAVPPERLVQSRDSLAFLDAAGQPFFRLALSPGGIAWRARTPRPAQPVS